MLFLHGYPSSSYDWRHLLELLPGRRTVCFDFLGFGLSEKPRDHLYSLLDQADLTEAVVARLGADEVVLVAHDMGTSVATELLARDVEGRLPFRLRSVVLLNGSMVIERASLTAAQKVLRSRFGPIAARLSNERSFRGQFARLFSPDHPLTPEEAADQWALLAHSGGHRIIDKLTYYLHERVTYAARWHGALRDWEGPGAGLGDARPDRDRRRARRRVRAAPGRPRAPLRGARPLPPDRGARAGRAGRARYATGQPKLRLNALRQAVHHTRSYESCDHVDTSRSGRSLQLDGVPVGASSRW